MRIIRFVVGFVCFSIGCAELIQIASGNLFANLPPHADSVDVLGTILPAAIMLGLGWLGLKMLTSLLRREKPAATPSQAPTTAS